eukprot:1016763-Amphidinium_carterae.2
MTGRLRQIAVHHSARCNNKDVALRQDPLMPHEARWTGVKSTAPGWYNQGGRRLRARKVPWGTLGNSLKRRRALSLELVERIAASVCPCEEFGNPKRRQQNKLLKKRW